MNKYKYTFVIAFALAALAIPLGRAGAQMMSGFSFNNDLAMGHSGQEVSDLQTFLISNGYGIPAISGGLASKGYFGMQTKQAVMAYQRANGLNPSGYFGPLTRAKIRAGGSGYGGGAGGGTLPPQAGALQLIAPNGGEVWQKNQYQTISWTGSAGIMSQTGSIWLLYPVPACAEEGAPYRCMVAVRAPELIVRNVPLSSGSYRWYAGGTLVSDCPTCGAPSPIADGQYKIRVCSVDSSVCDQSDAYFTLTSSSNATPSPYPYPYPTPAPTGVQPAILGIDAPTTLNVGQTGIWTVRASDPQNGTLSYSVDWGDTVRPPYGASTATAGGIFVQSATFNHSYSTTGIYTVVFTVRNASGYTVTSKATVSVGVGNPSQPITVTSPNGGETWKRGTNQAITWNNYGSNYQYQNPGGYVRITLDYQCPPGRYCAAVWPPTYIIQSSAPNGGSSSWLVGSATLDGTNPTQVPVGTYIMTVCKFDSYGHSGGCDSSDSYFNLTD